MNRLYLIKKIGFKVTWKLISVGLYGNREIPVLISRKDITLFLNELLMNNNACADDIIALLCEENYPTDFDVLLHKYASIDKSELPIQNRKWKACLLMEVLDAISEDHLQGILELIEFWVSMNVPNDCPQKFPIPNNKESINEYFSQESFQKLVDENRIWLEKEIADIISIENNTESKIVGLI